MADPTSGILQRSSGPLKTSSVEQDTLRELKGSQGILSCGEIDYTDKPDVIRLFIQTNSHPGNVRAFIQLQRAKNERYENGRKG